MVSFATDADLQMNHLTIWRTVSAADSEEELHTVQNVSGVPAGHYQWDKQVHTGHDVCFSNSALWV